MEDVRTKLDEELVRDFDEIKNLQPGTKQHSDAVEAIERLYKLRAEDTKIDAEFESLQVQEIRNENERVRNENEAKNNKTRNCIEAGKAVTQLSFAAWAIRTGLKFEETNILGRSGIVRQVLSKCIPFLKW